MADIVFRSHMREMEQKLQRAIDTAMEAVAQQGEGNAIREVTKLVYETSPSPHYIRTGDLRGSISHKYVKEEERAYIGTDLEYAPYVELGTRYMKKRPFLQNAAKNYSEEYKVILADGLRILSE